MTAPDFAAILADAMTSAEFIGRTIGSPPRTANLTLAAKIPELCTTCGGNGIVEGPERRKVDYDERDEPYDKILVSPRIPCPDCPTIGKLLAIGAAVMADEGQGNGERYADGWNGLLAELRAVRP